MGTDIHIWTEKQNKDGVWEAVRIVNETEVNWIKGVIQKDIEKEKKPDQYWIDRLKEEMNGVLEGGIYNGRNYDLFAILANVRNGRGFAGVVTGSGFNYISEPKGMPEDISSEVEDHSWGHSASWLTAREILEFDWDQFTRKCGIVTEDGYLEWKEKGQPSYYSGGVSGRNVRHITNEEMEDLIAGIYPREKDLSYYTEVRWTDSYKEVVGSFYDWSIPKLVELAEGDLDSVRIVFFFDS